MSKGEELLQKAVTDAHSETHPNSVITLELITGLVGAIFSFIQSCRSPATAQSRIKEGGIITTFQARRALKASGYDGHIPSMARALVKKGMDATTEELTAITSDAGDVTTPPEVSWGNPWAIALMFCAILFTASNLQAGDPWALALNDPQPTFVHAQSPEPTVSIQGPWSLDERVTKVETDIADIKNGMNSLGGLIYKMDERLAHLEARKPAPDLSAVPSPPAEPAQVQAPAKPLDQRLARLENSINAIEGMTERLLSNKIPEAVCGPQSEKLPAQSSPQKAVSVIQYNGTPIYDVNAFIKANPYSQEFGISNTTWTDHLKYHGYSGNFNSLTERQKLAIHSIAHLSGHPRIPSGTTLPAIQPARSQTAVTTVASANTGCANGGCAQQYQYSRPSGYWRTGIFGGKRWVSN